MNKSFVTVVNCIDGRAQKPVIEFVIKKFKVNYVDLITEPGPDKVLSENKPIGIIKSIKRRILVSIKKHKSDIIIIVGHYGCVANSVGKEEHYRQIEKSLRNVRKWNLKVNVYGAWVNKNWEVVLL